MGYTDECVKPPPEGNHEIIWGVLFCLLSCIFSDTGLILEKRAINIAAQKLGADNVVYYKLKGWWVGFVLFIGGQVIFAIALSLASTLILLPLGSFTLVVNIFMSTFFLKEPLRLSEVLCTLLIISGASLAAFFGPVVDTQPVIYCIEQGFLQMLFYLPAISVIILQISIYIFARTWVQRVKKQRNMLLEIQDKEDNDGIEETAQLLVAPENDLSKSMMFKVAKWAYPVLSGSTQVWTIFTGTMLSRMFRQIFSGDIDVAKTWVPWVALAVWIPLAVTWQTLVSTALLMLDARYVIPVDFSVQVLVNMIVTGLFFDEFRPELLPHVKMPWFFLGVALCVLGVGLLGWSSSLQSEQAKAREIAEVLDPVVSNSGDIALKEDCTSHLIRFSISGVGWGGPMMTHTSVPKKVSRLTISRVTLAVMQQLPSPRTLHATPGGSMTTSDRIDLRASR